MVNPTPTAVKPNPIKIPAIIPKMVFLGNSAGGFWINQNVSCLP